MKVPVQAQGTYPGQSMDDAVTGAIQYVGGKLLRSDVSKSTSENFQLGTSLLTFIVSKGRNGKAGTELTEQLLKKNTDDLAESITEINKKFSDGSPLNEGGLESLLDSASRYENVGEQGAKIYNSIVGQLFNNGSKRTATEFIEKFAKDNNLKFNIDSNQLKELTSEIANGAKFSTEELAKRLFVEN